MKKIAILFAFSLSIFSCEKDNNDLLIGKWKLVEGFDVMAGGKYTIPVKDQRMEEYTIGNIRILYDFEGNEIGRCNYKATETIITVYGANQDGKEWSFSDEYWFLHDTLTIKQDGGFESYNEYFIRIE